MHSGPFGCLTKLGAKRAELVQKFVPQRRVGIFRNESARSTPLDPKLTFWSVLYYLVHSGLFGCLTKLGAKQAELVQKVHATKWRRNFSQRMHPIHPIGPETDVLERFLLFGFIQDRLLALRYSVQKGPNYCKSSCHEVESDFFATKAPDPPHVTQN